jgi:hypothetical protein
MAIFFSPAEVLGLRARTRHTFRTLFKTSDCPFGYRRAHRIFPRMLLVRRSARDDYGCKYLRHYSAGAVSRVDFRREHPKETR